VFLSDVSIRRPVFTVIVSAMLLLFGAISWPKLGVDMFPNVEAPYISISTIYVGADPEVVESRVIEPIEDAVSTVSGVKSIRAIAVESYGLVMVEFDLEINADIAAQDVRERIAKIQQELPGDAELPVVEKFQIGAVPVISLVLTASGSRPSAAEMTYVAEEKVKKQIQQLRGVGSVDIIGKQEREIHVVADPAKLRVYGLTLPDIQQAVAYGNMDIPGGHVTSAARELLIKTYGEAKSIDELRSLVVAAPGGAPIRLADVSTIYDAEAEARTKATWDGQPALSMLVRKQSGANTVAVADAVIDALKSGQIKIPPEYKLEIAQNQSDFTRHAIMDVVFDLVFGACLAVAVILFFLRDARATFISALALPTSVVATFAFMLAMGFTANILTMLALSLSIGMLIDDAIVVIENIHRHLEMGKTAIEAAADGAREIGLAVLATTLSIVAVFVPVAFMKGLMGRFFYEFGLTVAFAIMVSLFVSFTLTPMASSIMLRHNKPGVVARGIGKMLDGLDSVYRRIIGWILNQRALTVAVGVAAMVLSLVLAQRMPVEFQPSMDQGEMDVTFSMPEGTSLDATFRRGEEIQQVVLQTARDEIRHLMVSVGAGANQKVNEGRVFCKFAGSKHRARSVPELKAALRAALNAALPDTEMSLLDPDIAASGGDEQFSKDINVELRGTDTKQLRDTARLLTEEMKKYADPTGGKFVDVAITDKGERPQFGYRIKRDKVAQAGLMPAQVATAIRTAVTGTESSQFRVGSDRYKVVVKAPDLYRQQESAVLTMPLRGPMNNLVEVGELVESFPEHAPAQIDRQDRSRVVTVLANLDGMAMGQGQTVMKELTAKVMPPGVTMEFGGQGKIMIESFGYMFEALALAVAIIYMVLAAQFESFLHPLTIMVSLPLSVIGALGALLLAGESFSIMSFIGLIMLMGLVTKNAILLVDNANQRRREGVPIREAVIEAGAVRLRPILMTTGAMIFGMLPIALALGEGAEMRAPMGICVIGGLVTSTLLTLLVVPAVYSAFEGAKVRLMGR